MDDRLKNIKNNLNESQSIAGDIILKEIENSDDYCNDKEKMFEHLKFLSSVFNATQSEITMTINKQISTSIQELSNRNDWVNLGQVAKHALRERVEVVKRDKNRKLLKMIKDVTENCLEFIDLSLDDQNRALKSLKEN